MSEHHQNTEFYKLQIFLSARSCYNHAMKRRVHDGGALLRYERGEELVSCLAAFAREVGRTGSFTVIGATSEIELGFYHLDRKEYEWKVFSGEFEVTGGVGNIAFHGEDPIVHLHTTIADNRFAAFGGHVRRLIVGATCEVSLSFHPDKLERAMDDGIGLKLWEL